MACIGSDENGKQPLLGKGRVKEYKEKKPEVFDQLYSYLSVGMNQSLIDDFYKEKFF